MSKQETKMMYVEGTQVADAVANTLVQLLRSVEVTPDRLAKRYPEVRAHEQGPTAVKWYGGDPSLETLM